MLQQKYIIMLSWHLVARMLPCQNCHISAKQRHVVKIVTKWQRHDAMSKLSHKQQRHAVKTVKLLCEKHFSLKRCLNQVHMWQVYINIFIYIHTHTYMLYVCRHPARPCLNKASRNHPTLVMHWILGFGEAGRLPYNLVTHPFFGILAEKLR